MVVFTQKDVDTTRDFALAWSECVRRKYGSLIVDQSQNPVVLATNRRVGKYCNNKVCIRDYCKAPHGERVELGGEIHSEQAALVQFQGYAPDHHFLLVGTDKNGEQLDGIDNYPCHVCAMMIKYAGFRNVWMPFGTDIKPVSIDEILEHYERMD